MNVKARRSKGLRKSMKGKCKVDDGGGGKGEGIGGTLIKYTSSDLTGQEGELRWYDTYYYQNRH